MLTAAGRFAHPTSHQHSNLQSKGNMLCYALMMNMVDGPPPWTAT